MTFKLHRATLRRGWVLGVTLSGALLVAGAVSYGLYGLRPSGLLLLALGAAWGLSWCFAWLLVQGIIVHPLEQLGATTETLATQDSIALAGALAALGRGDLMAQVALQTQMAPVPALPPLNRLAHALNHLISNLRDCAHEFNLVTGEPCQCLCFVSPDNYLMGRAAGEAMGQALSGNGEVVVLFGRHETLQDVMRRRGFESVLREKYPAIAAVDVGETQIKPDIAYALTQGFLKRYPHLGGIYITEGSSPCGAARAIVEAGLAGKVKIVAHDLVDQTMAYVAQGVIAATIGQSPYVQGYNAVIHLFNHLVTGWRPETPRLVIEPDVVTPENYRQYWYQGGEVMATAEAATRLAKSMQPSPRPLRIAKAGSDNVFWDPIWAGAEAAANECHIRLEKIVLFETDSISSAMATLESAVDRAIAGQYDGVVASSGPPGFSPILNRLSAAGIPVVIVNYEQPPGFRGLITMLGEQTQGLVEVSHELRTPLSMLVGLSEMMLTPSRPGVPPLPEYYRRDLERIRANAEQLKWLIGDVLDLASSQAGQLRLTKTRLPLGEVVRVVADMGEEMARANGLRWQAEIPDDLPAVWGDRLRLQQVILNLLANACRFTPAGTVRLAVQVTGSEAQISVSDTGLGIPPEERASVFDEFHKSKRTLERGYSGLGLGLTIARRLVQMHGGRIWVESSGKIGEGATFCFTLPVLATSPEPVEAGLEEAIHGQTLLLMTEGEEQGDPMGLRLREAGWKVECVRIPAFAEPGQLEQWLAEVLAGCRPRAVVLGLALDSEIGWTLMRALRAHPAMWDIPTVFYVHLVGQAGSALVEMDCLTKPVATEVLEKTLARYGVVDETSRKTVLVVEDEPGLLDLYRRIVERQAPGCRVLMARNGREALEAMRQQQPDLVLLDLRMPELDGFGVLEAMQAGQTTRMIPVIVLTAHVLTEADMARLNRGVAAVMSKGVFSEEEISAQIAAALERHKRLGSGMQRLVRQAMAYMHEHYAEPISRVAVASHVGVHENYLSRCFHQELGLTPMAYLNRYRVNQAKIMLEDDRSITDVAFAVGFSSSEHFSRVFKAEVGVSPSAYRGSQWPAGVLPST